MRRLISQIFKILLQDIRISVETHSFIENQYKEVKNGLAFPTLLNIILRVLFFVVEVPIIYLFSKALKLRPKPLTIADSRKEVLLVYLVTMPMLNLKSF